MLEYKSILKVIFTGGVAWFVFCCYAFFPEQKLPEQGHIPYGVPILQYVTGMSCIIPTGPNSMQYFTCIN